MRNIWVALGIVIFVEIVIPGSVIFHLWYIDAEISFKAFMDTMVAVHLYPVGPISVAFNAFGLPPKLAFGLASAVMMLCELAVATIVLWLLFSFYRETRKIVSAEWAKE